MQVARAARTPSQTYIASPAASWLDDFLSWISPEIPRCCRAFTEDDSYCPPPDQPPCSVNATACANCTTCFRASGLPGPELLKGGRPTLKQVQAPHAALSQPCNFNSSLCGVCPTRLLKVAVELAWKTPHQMICAICSLTAPAHGACMEVEHDYSQSCVIQKFKVLTVSRACRRGSICRGSWTLCRLRTAPREALERTRTPCSAAPRSPAGSRWALLLCQLHQIPDLSYSTVPHHFRGHDGSDVPSMGQECHTELWRLSEHR